MAPTSSVDALRAALAPHAPALHDLAHHSIRRGFLETTPPTVPLRDQPVPLRDMLASFVTLRQDGELRGCVGTAFAARPLAEDVTRNAFLAAFHDTRFAPLAASEFAATEIEISVLSSPDPLPFSDESELMAQLVPGRDGLILEEGTRRGLFLPQVWEMLPDVASFLDHLKDKAGFSAGPLDPAVRALRFSAIKFA